MAAHMAPSVTERYEAVQERIGAACRRAGRGPAEVRLIAVTKGVSAETIRTVAAAGARRFGENYVQEWRAKRDQLADLADLEWHFIGRVQRNKARPLGDFALVHSVADIRSAAALAAEGGRRRAVVPVLVQVNLAGEQTKAGISASELSRLLAEIRNLRGIRVEGLMTMPPPLPPEEVRPLFRALRVLRDRQEGAGELRELSMGMSADFEVAIEEGATLVRVGTAIFGPRRKEAT